MLECLFMREIFISLLVKRDKFIKAHLSVSLCFTFFITSRTPSLFLESLENYIFQHITSY